MNTKMNFCARTLATLRSFKHSDLKAIASASHVPEGTVRKLYYGEVKDPRVSTIEALHDYFSRRRNPQEAEHA